MVANLHRTVDQRIQPVEQNKAARTTVAKCITLDSRYSRVMPVSPLVLLLQPLRIRGADQASA